MAPFEWIDRLILTFWSGKIREENIIRNEYIALMKVLLVHNHYKQPGGEDSVLAAETALLREHGHEVEEYMEDNKRIQGPGQTHLNPQHFTKIDIVPSSSKSFPSYTE